MGALLAVMAYCAWQFVCDACDRQCCTVHSGVQQHNGLWVAAYNIVYAAIGRECRNVGMRVVSYTTVQY